MGGIAATVDTELVFLYWGQSDIDIDVEWLTSQSLDKTVQATR